MRRLALAIPALLVAAACDAAGPGNDGPLAIGVVSGDNQVAPAGAEQLPDPVVGKLVRQPGGGITFRLVTPAYAQGTVVNGSPVAGAVVCAVNVQGAAQLEAFTPCTNTDANGTATFFFAPGTKAGEAVSEIRGTVEGEPAVFDSVTATVEPGALYSVGLEDGARNRQEPWWFYMPYFQDAWQNSIPFDIEVTGDALYRVEQMDDSTGLLGTPGLAISPDAAIGDTARITWRRLSDDSVLAETTATIVQLDEWGWGVDLTHDPV